MNLVTIVVPSAYGANPITGEEVSAMVALVRRSCSEPGDHGRKVTHAMICAGLGVSANTLYAYQRMRYKRSGRVTTPHGRGMPHAMMFMLEAWASNPTAARLGVFAAMWADRIPASTD